jgi:deoxyribonuclease-4
MVRAADRAAEIGASTMQVFSDNPTAWRRRRVLPRELPAFQARLAALDLAPLAIHAPYLINLAGPDPEVFERSVAVLTHELSVAAAYGAALVNVHIGSHRGTGPEAGAARVAEGLARVQASLDGPARDVTIVLEIGAGSGFGFGSTVEELCLIDVAATAAGVDRSAVGFCLDTAHAWGAGYGLDTPAGVDALLDAFDRSIGLPRLRLVHLNDSRAERGSHQDRHEHIGGGQIGTAGLRRLLEHPGLAHVPYILETPGMDDGWDAINLARVRDIAEGRPLVDLPPEAFTVRSARDRSAPAPEHGENAPGEAEEGAAEEGAADKGAADKGAADKGERVTGVRDA